MANVFSSSGSGLLGQTNGLANKAITSSPLTSGGNSNIASGLSVNPLTGNVGQGSLASLTAGTLGGGYPANVSTANSLLGPLDTSSQEVKKVVSSPDGTQEVHLYPSTSSQNTTASNTGGSTSSGSTLYPPGSSGNGGAITQANDQPNLPVTPASPAAQVFDPTTGTWGAAKPQTPFAQATGGLLGAPAQNTQLGQNATDITAKYDKQIADLARLSGSAGDLSTGTSLVGGGNATLDANAISSRINALTQQEQQELAASGQAITAQGQGQSALSSAGTLTQPSASFPFVFNPATGTFTSSGGNGGAGLTGNYQGDISSAAAAIMKDPTLYNSYSSSLNGFYGATAKSNLDAAIIKAGGNPTNYAAQGTGIAQGIGQAGVNAGTAAQAIGKAQPVAQNLDALIQSNNINPYNITYANGAVNFLKSNFGTPQQQTAMTEFSGQLNDLASTLAPILGIPGGATTDFKTSLGQSIVNGLQNGQSVQQSINYFISQAQQGAAGAYSGGTNPIQTINTPTNSSQSVTLGSGTQARYVNGKWVLGNQ